MSLSSNKQPTMRGILRRPEDVTQPSPTTKIWASALSREVLLSDKFPTNTSPCRPAPRPPGVEYAEGNLHSWETGAKMSKPSNPVYLSPDKKLAQSRSRSRTKHLSLPENAAQRLSRSRSSSPAAQAGLRRGRSPACLRHADDAPQVASLQQFSGTNAASYRPSRHPVARRFSYEDYKHTQFMEWLEREV
jgi:hypothetical protein